MVPFPDRGPLHILLVMSRRPTLPRASRIPALRRTAAFPLPLLLAAGFWLAGCAVQSQSAWQDNAPRNQTFKKVLVVGMSPNFNQRCAFEFSLVSHILSSQVTAIASCDLMTSKDELTRDNIVRVVQSSGVDAVVSTTLVKVDLKSAEGAGRDSQGGGYYKATGFGYATDAYGVYGVPVTYGQFVESPSITTVHGEAHVATRVYETSGAKLVYTIDTKAKHLESQESAFSDLAQAIADSLRHDRLIR
jgi:hypothetical protein